MTVKRIQRTDKRFKAGMAWTEDEVARLIKLYPTNSNKDLAVIYGRSVWGVTGKARELNLKKDYTGSYQRQSPLSCAKWSTKEMGLLRKLFLTTANEEIAERIGRSLDAIANKARKMGLRKIEFWSQWEDNLIIKLYKTLTFEELAGRLGRTTGSVKIRTIKLGLECKVENWTEAESDFLRRNYHTMGYQAIAEHLGRTYDAVAAKASRIGIKKNRSSNKVNIKIAKSSPYINGSGLTRSRSFLDEVTGRCDKSIVNHY
jgi:hypothetical protein